MRTERHFLSDSAKAVLSDIVADFSQPIENIGAGEGNRTLVISLEGCCSTIELHPHRPHTLGALAALGQEREP
jgi:hypothetical protein